VIVLVLVIVIAIFDADCVTAMASYFNQPRSRPRVLPNPFSQLDWELGELVENISAMEASFGVILRNRNCKLPISLDKVGRATEHLASFRRFE
jgi:hypothetical protein